MAHVRDDVVDLLLGENFVPSRHRAIAGSSAVAAHAGRAVKHTGDGFVAVFTGAAADAVAALAREPLDAGITLLDVGEHRLRDLDRPERVFQACADGLERQFPPLRSLTRPASWLPAVRTRIIGRGRLLATIADRFGDAALVTLTGVGGSGKIRLAIEVGRRVGELLPDGGIFVDLFTTR